MSKSLRKRIKAFSIALLIAFNIIVLLLAFTGHVTFGHGLGDIGYLVMMAFLSACIIGSFYLIKSALAMLVFTLLLVTFLSLKLTVNRGPEYPWDGNIFYQSRASYETIE